MTALACRWISGTPAERVRAFRAAARAAENAPWCRAVVEHAQRFYGTPGAPPVFAILRWFHAHVRYVPAPQNDRGDDWFCDPRAVLDRGGDCDQLAALLATLLETAGETTLILWVGQPENDQDHVTVVVWLRGAWRWCEPCVPGARVGEDPWDAAERTGARF